MDSILYWNAVALEANRRDFSNVPGTGAASPEQGGPTLSSRALAIVHLAMYDAHFGSKGVPATPRYLSTPPTPLLPLDAPTAVAAAAHGALSALFPRQKAHFDAAHRDADLVATATSADAHAFGLAVAAAILADRKDDPGVSDNGYAAPQYPGAHRPDPANPTQGFHAPFYGAAAKCFASSRLALTKPPALTTIEYDNAVKQVRGKGIAPELVGTLPLGFTGRTPEETMIGIFWAYDGVREIGTPPRLYNQIVRKVAVAQNKGVDENARLFALVNVAMGDAGILAWEQKYVHNLWRPVVGIREHDPSLGPNAPQAKHALDPDCDPLWLPLGAPASNSANMTVGNDDFTPGFPAYPSGHATFGAAALHMTRLFYKTKSGDRGPDKLFSGLDLVSDELNGVTRDGRGVVRPRHRRAFPDGLWQMIIENGFSRVFLGVHWSFDAFALDATGTPDLSKNIGGVALGLAVAEDIFGHANGAPVKP